MAMIGRLSHVSIAWTVAINDPHEGGAFETPFGSYAYGDMFSTMAFRGNRLALS